MASREAQHRVSVVVPPDELGQERSVADSRPPSIPVPRDDRETERVAVALGEVVALLRAGAGGHVHSDGVLLDVIAGDVHVIVLERVGSQQIELSPREQEIALMVARGRTNQAIASALEISVWTVSTHLRRIFAKLAVSSRAEMVAHLLTRADFASQVGRAPLH
jgi:DNA-binding CsgD family transcriptional regulator